MIEGTARHGVVVVSVEVALLGVDAGESVEACDAGAFDGFAFGVLECDFGERDALFADFEGSDEVGRVGKECSRGHLSHFEH